MASAYCDSCGTKLASEQIDSGEALAYDGAYYCGECKQDVLPLIGKQEKRQGKAAGAPAAAKAGGNGAPAGGESAAKSAKSAQPTATKRAARRAAGTARPKAAAAGRSSEIGAKAAKAVGKRPRAADTSAKAGAGKAKVRAKAKAAGSVAARAGVKPARKGAATSSKGTAAGGRKVVKRRARTRAELGDVDPSKVVKRKRRVSSSRRRSGSGSMEAALGGDRKKLWLWGGVGAAVLAVILVLVVFGGSKETKSDKADGGTQLASSTALEQEQAAQELFEETKQAIGDPPKDGYAAAIRQWSRLRSEMTPSWAEKVDAEIERLKIAQRDAAKAALETLAKKAKELEDKGEITAALDLWSSASQEVRAAEAWKEIGKPAIERLEKLVLARLEAEPLLARADELAGEGQTERAIGVLEGFDLETHRGTPWAKKVQDRIRELGAGGDKAGKEAALAAVRAAEQAEKQRIAAARAEKKRKDLARVANERWEGQGVDLFIWKLPEPTPKEAWVTEGKELVCRAPSTPLGNGKIAALAGVGKPSWADYYVHFAYKIERGELFFGVRSNGRAFVQLEPELIADGQWHELTVLVYGDGDDAFEQVLPNGQRRRIGFDAHDSWNGGVVFGVGPNGVVRLRDIKVKVIRDEK
ncbi:MAG: hypothetical protein D6776_04525 [Planctomycetota bacterium]|nr:MAG: hypothetical protein D6776_04525 [Planctomycetota bacterium]